MMMNNLQRILIDEAKRNPNVTQPISGWNPADHPIFNDIKAAHPFHFTPSEMLASARSVFAFFLPFTDEVVRSNRRAVTPSKLWAEAYIETNRSIREISEKLVEHLRLEGYQAVFEPATHNFDPKTLVSSWSHKHIAYACGLGSFGLHQMLITSKGCSGRFGSLVTDLNVNGGTRVLELHESCLYYTKGTCHWCVDHCPTKALTMNGLDKQRCYEQCLETDRNYSDLGLCDVCGQCAVGPCAQR